MTLVGQYSARRDRTVVVGDKLVNVADLIRSVEVHLHEFNYSFVKL